MTASRHGLEAPAGPAALAWIDDDLTREFPLAVLAEPIHPRAAQLTRLFGRLPGVTPMRCVSARHGTARRVREAQGLLVQTNRPVARIAAHLGYVDASHFTQRFRIDVGTTPAAWRRRSRGG